MKYFQVIGKSTDEVAKKILQEYNGRAYIIKLIKETKQEKNPSKWYHKGFIKPKSTTSFYYRAYCSLPEDNEDIDVIQDLKTPPVQENITNDLVILQEPKQDLTIHHNPLETSPYQYQNNLQLQADIIHLKEVMSHLYYKSQDSKNTTEFLPYLLDKGFSYDFSTQFLSSLQTDIKDIGILKLILKEKLRMKILVEDHFQFKKGESYLFLGSTGVGKTTTLAKMAAICYKQGLDQFQFVSFDSYRLGADEQLKRFADIFEKPFHLIQNEEEMKLIVKKKKPNDILFLDTAGESISQDIKIPEVLHYLTFMKDPVKIFLVLSAHTKLNDLYAIKKQFEKFEIYAYIITKLDETKILGNILEFLSSQGIKTTFYTDGQAVPNDIKLLSLEEFFEYI